MEQTQQYLQSELKKVLAGTKVGDSIAVNGICLTVTRIMPHAFTADVMHETLNRSSLANAMRGAHVNLERAMAADGRFGGHIVSGHVDGTGRIVEVKKDDNAIWYTIMAEASLMKYIVEKGSIAIRWYQPDRANGVTKIFHIHDTAYGKRDDLIAEEKRGMWSILKNDIIGKYVEQLLQYTKRRKQEPPDKEFLFAGRLLERSKNYVSI